MSMILDAIKRSKEVDTRGDVPSVDTEHFVASHQTRSWTTSLTGITLGCLALLLIGGVFYATSLFKSPSGAASAPLDVPGSVSAANCCRKVVILSHSRPYPVRGLSSLLRSKGRSHCDR